MIGKDNPFHYYPDFLTSSTLELRRYENERHYKHDYQAPRRPRREWQRVCLLGICFTASTKDEYDPEIVEKDGAIEVPSVSVQRTARRIMDGTLYIRNKQNQKRENVKII